MNLVIGWTILILAMSRPSSPPLTMTVVPRIVFAGQSLRVECRLQRTSLNRMITLGVRDWTASTRQVDGAAAPITWTQIFAPVPCDVGPAFCTVTRAASQPALIVEQSIDVVGCVSHHSTKGTAP